MLSGLAMADVLVEIPLETSVTVAGQTLQAVKVDWDK